jgi:hypothetical protein
MVLGAFSVDMITYFLRGSVREGGSRNGGDVPCFFGKTGKVPLFQTSSNAIKEPRLIT